MAVSVLLWLATLSQVSGLLEGRGGVFDLAFAVLFGWLAWKSWPRKREPKPAKGRHRAGVR